MRVKRIAIPLVVLAAATLAVVSYSADWFGGEPSNQISFSGNIEMTEVKVGFKTPGRIELLSLKEGDWVDQGQVVARLDTTQLQRQHDRVRAATTAAEQRLDQMATAIEYQAETVEGQIEQRRAEVGNAQAVLNELLAGSRKQDVEQARAAVERAKTEQETAERDWQRAQVLFKNEDISASAHDQARTRQEAATAALKQAEERLSLVQEGPRPETIEAARAQLRRAEAGLRLAEATRLELKRTRQEREARASDVGQVKAEQAVVEAQLDDAIAVAPTAGVVLVKSAEQGEVVAAGTTVLTLGDVDHPWLRGYIGEQDLGRVRLGAPVRVTTDSFPGKVYRGKVTFISSEAEFTPKQIQTPEERVKLVYRVKVEVENPNRELKSNMPADAEIVLE